MSVLITFVAINNEETPKMDFASKYFLEVKTVAIRTTPPPPLILFLELVIIYPLNTSL